MKVERKESEFHPIVITIETQDELDQFAAMAYYCTFDDSKGEDVTEKLYQNLYNRVVTKYRSANSIAIDLEIDE